ncbi:MAG: transcriptional repressor [Bdellovibrionales bacterium]|nr:transcriptional repressor [Bdellovibrionales bacterium]
MARGDSAVRLLKVIMYLEHNPKGLTVKELHSRLVNDMIECSERTVYRILQVVERAHFPVYSEAQGDDLSSDRRWRFRRTTALSESSF